MNTIQGIGGLEPSMIKKNDNVPVNDERHGLQANELNDKTKKSMLTRIISAIVLVAIVVPSMILGDYIYFALMTIAIGFACFEILGCAGKRTFFIYIVYVIFVALIAYWPLFKGLIVDIGSFSKIDPYFRSIYLPITIVIAGFFLLFWLTVIYKDFSVVDASFLVAMGILIGFGFQCMFYLRYMPMTYLTGDAPKEAMHFTVDNTIYPSLLLLFVIVSAIMTDTGAYFVGVFFGKHKMNERISPNKTWEGFWGGIVVSFVITSIIGLTFAFCNAPILVVLDKDHWYNILVLSFLTPFFATLGDFVFSSIKRYWGIKDYGKLIPGHGGVLDRLDSIFFAAIVSSIFIFIVTTGITPTGELSWKDILV